MSGGNSSRWSATRWRWSRSWLRIDYRYAGRGADRFGPLAKELVSLQPDVIFAQSTGVVAAVQRETRTIPVVFANVSDPVGSGFVASLPRPGSNLTGMLLFDGGLSAKWLSMLKEISPRLRRAVLMIDPKTTPLDYFYRPAEAVAPSLALEIGPSLVESAADIERAMEANGRIPDSGVVIAPGSTMLRNRDLVIALAIRHRRRRLRAGPVQAGGRRCLPAGTLRPDVHGAAQRVDPETALVGRSAPEVAAPEDPDVEIFTRERSHADIPSASSGDSHAELGSRFRQAIQPTTIDSVATISGGTPCPYSPWRVTVASAANITVQPSAEPHSRVRACASRTAVVSSSDPVTKWNQCGYPHRRYSS
jgi:hypothetical protein